MSPEEGINHSSKSLEDQVLYKLGSLESLITNGMRRIDEQLATLAKNMVEHRIESSEETAKLDERVTKLEEWKTASKARVAGVIFAFTVIWAVFADAVQSFLHRIFN